LVTAPQFRNVQELFARVGELRDSLLDGASNGTADQRAVPFPDGSVRYRKPATAASMADSVDHVIVDEAAALPVRLLESFLDAPSVAFATTVHGYEGTGRGFSVRFRGLLEESDFDVTSLSLAEPIRYAAGDPVEAAAIVVTVDETRRQVGWQGSLFPDDGGVVRARSGQTLAVYWTDGPGGERVGTVTLG
jgi:tRNA(Met) cytidine acetyltransferase